MFQKPFNEWNEEKQYLHKKDISETFFKEGDIWMISCGVNVGFEQDGKNKNKGSFLKKEPCFSSRENAGRSQFAESKKDICNFIISNY